MLVRRWVSVVAALALAGGASGCSLLGKGGGSKPGAAPPPASKDSIDQVERWAGAGASAEARPDAAVPGYQVFLVKLPPNGASGETYEGAGLSDSSKKVLAGKDVLTEALTHWQPTSPELAKAAAVLVDKGAQPLLAPPAGIDVDHTDPADRALVAYPHIENRTLVYWSYQRAGDAPGLVQTRVDLSTFEVQRVPLKGSATPTSTATATSAPASADVERIRTLLASSNAPERQQALDMMQARCTDASVRPVLENALTASTTRVSTRKAMLVIVDKCHALASVPVLGKVLASDTDPTIRTAAADVLGRFKDQAALPFLDTAANGDSDPNVRKAAKAAAALLRKNGH